MKNFLPRIFQDKEIRDIDIEGITATEEYQNLAASNQMNTEEKAQLKSYLQNIDLNNMNSPYAPESYENPGYGPITFWDKREVIVSNKDVTPDGLAMPATKTLSLMYALTIEDAVVFVDPNTDLDEKVIAGLFLIPTPAKFGKPFLKQADDLGGTANAGRKGKTDGSSLDSKGIDKFNDSVKSGEKARQHSEIKNKNSLPGKGEPNTSVDLLNPDGTVKQRRYYDEKGSAKEDIDFYHSDDGMEISFYNPNGELDILKIIIENENYLALTGFGDSEGFNCYFEWEK